MIESFDSTNRHRVPNFVSRCFHRVSDKCRILSSDYIMKLSNQVFEVVEFSEVNPTQGTFLGYYTVA